MSKTDYEITDTIHLTCEQIDALSSIADKYLRIDVHNKPYILYGGMLQIFKGYESMRDNQSHERKRLIEFFMFFRDFAEHFIGLSIEQFVDEFYEMEQKNGKL